MHIQIYEPLSAKILLLGGNGGGNAFSSFTGHGYSLPPNIDIIEVHDDDEEDDVVKDDDEEDDDHISYDNEPYEHPSTHKYYNVVEFSDDEIQEAVRDNEPHSPVFPRGPMPGGFHHNYSGTPPLPLLPQQQHHHHAPQQQHDYADLFGNLQIPVLGSLFNQRVPTPRPISPPPILAPIACYNNYTPNPLIPPSRPAPEIIYVDEDERDREVIDVDAIGSPEREPSPVFSEVEDAQRPSMDEDEDDDDGEGSNDEDDRERSPSSSPVMSRGTSLPASEDHHEADEGQFSETQNLADVLNVVKVRPSTASGLTYPFSNPAPSPPRTSPLNSITSSTTEPTPPVKSISTKRNSTPKSSLYNKTSVS